MEVFPISNISVHVTFRRKYTFLIIKYIFSHAHQNREIQNVPSEFTFEWIISTDSFEPNDDPFPEFLVNKSKRTDYPLHNCDRTKLPGREYQMTFGGLTQFKWETWILRISRSFVNLAIRFASRPLVNGPVLCWLERDKGKMGVSSDFGWASEYCKGFGLYAFGMKGFEMRIKLYIEVFVFRCVLALFVIYMKLGYKILCVTCDCII